MKMIAALVVLLAIAGTAAAWEISDELTYTYTKDLYQQAGDELVKPSLAGASSQASFTDPGNEDVYVWSSQGKLENELTGVLVDRDVFFPAADLNYANFYATLEQGGSAKVNLQAMDSVDNSIPEMAGEAKAYQDLQIAGGFDEAAATFNSRARVGADDKWVVTSTGPTDPLAFVSAEKMGGGEIKSASLGEMVVADFEQAWDGTGWNNMDYSGGIKMWAMFDAACDPLCTNPIVSGVNGQSWTGAFPGDDTIPEWAAPFFWGNNWENDPVPQNEQDFGDGTIDDPVDEDDNVVGDTMDPADW